jgi:hypothetical protein
MDQGESMSIMRLLPGDLADRQTIVELKINHCNAEFDGDEKDRKEISLPVARTLVSKNAVNVAPFLDELDLIRKKLAQDWVPDLERNNKVEEYDKLYDALAEANLQLWNLEDEIRVLRAAPERISQSRVWLIRAAECGVNISETNDIRASLIKQINALWNYNTQEKFY